MTRTFRHQKNGKEFSDVILAVGVCIGIPTLTVLRHSFNLFIRVVFLLYTSLIPWRTGISGIFFCKVIASFAKWSSRDYGTIFLFSEKSIVPIRFALLSCPHFDKQKNLPNRSPKGLNEREKNRDDMNMVKVYIKGQEDKELSSFFRYYPVRIKNIGMDAFFDRQVVYDFKDGRNQAVVAKSVAKMLVEKVGCKVGKVVFSCIPASSQERNVSRWQVFSELVCKLSGAIDGFSHVKVVGERTAVHGTKVKKDERMKRLKDSANIVVDADFFKNKIVCIWDDVVTTGTSFCAYTALLEQVGAHVTNGIFLAKTSYKYVQQ